jgi:hypothetical protein
VDGERARRSEADGARSERPEAAPLPAVLQLQQSIGNRAVQRLVGSPMIQRYAMQPAGANWQGLGKAMKVSDDGKMAVQDIALYPEGMGRAHQEFYATPDVIASATGTLAGLRSIYAIQQGAALPNPAPTGQAMHKVDVENKVIGNLGNGAATPLNCDDNTRQFLGLEIALPEQMARKQLRTTISQKGVFGRRAKNVDHSPTEGFDTGRAGAFKEATGKTGPKATAKYRALSPKKKEDAARNLGINEFAKAGQGGAYGVWGDSPGLRHFAPILAKSGEDEVALEAHVHNKTPTGPAGGEIQPGDRADYNPEWYFQMYGSVKQLVGGGVDDQTFYGRHAAQFPGDAALTVIPFSKLPSTLGPDASAAEHHKLVLDAVARNQRTAANIVKQFPAEANLPAAITVLTTPPAAVPADPTTFAAWLNAWADAIELAIANLDPTLRAIVVSFVKMKLHAAKRNTRRYALMIA